MSYIKIHSSDDFLKTQRILDVLEENGIPAYSQEKGAEQYFQIIGGMAFFVKDIYVAEEKAKDAAKLIHQSLTELEEEGEGKEEYRIPWYSKYRHWIVRVNAILLLVFFVVILVYSFVSGS